MPHMPKEFKSITEVISKEKAFEKIRQVTEEYDIIEEFNKIFPELKQVAKAIRVENKTLFLRVENSVWRSELNLKKNLITDKVNKHYSKKVLKAIKFVA